MSTEKPLLTDREKMAATAETSLANLSTTDVATTDSVEETLEATEEVLETEVEETEKEAEEIEGEIEATSTEQKPKKKGGFQKRIDKLNGKISAIEQEREYWRQEALRNQNVQKTDGKVIETQVDISKRPKADDFKTADEYTEALTDWKVDQKLKSEKQKIQQDVIKTEFQSKITKHQERVDKFKDSHDDFDDMIESVSNINLPMAVQESIIDSESGPELMYELARDPKELKRICSLSPLAAAREMGKLEVQLKKDSKTPSKEIKTTKTPKPPTPVRTKGSTSTKSFRNDMSLKEYDAWRNEQSKSG